MIDGKLRAFDPDYQFRLYAAEVAKMDNLVPPSERDGEAAIKRDRKLMVRINRDMYLNVPIYRALVNAIVTNVIGEDGAEFSPALDDDVVAPELVAKIRRKWLRWTRRADFSGRRSFTEVERMVLTELIVVGEVLLIKRYAPDNPSEPVLQLVESERIDEVKTDPFTGAITHFMIDPMNGSDPIRVDAGDAIYLSLTDRPSQTRGIGLLWACCPEINMISFILRSSAKSWAVACRLAFAIKKSNTSEVVKQMAGLTGEDDEELGDRLVEVGDALIVVLKPGEEVGPINHNGLPNAQLRDHILTFLRIIAGSIGFDAATVVLQDFSEVSFVSYRAAGANRAATVKRLQNHLRYHFYDRTGRWLLGTWEYQGELEGVPFAVFADGIDWIFPTPPAADAKTEAEVDGAELDRGLATFDEKLRARNKEPEAHLEAIKQEVLRADRLAQEVATATAGRVSPSWERFAGLVQGKTEAAVVAAQMPAGGKASA